MEFAQQLRALAERIPSQTGRLGSQAATSQSLVMPFIQAMGYSPFDPGETVPQFDVDLGNGKTETVDYALVQEDVPIILIDVKKWDTKLSDLHTSRLYRCFPVSDARFAVLTNGIEYRIYSDVSEPNRMDRKPYFTFSMAALDDRALGVLESFTKAGFDYDALLDTAAALTGGGVMQAPPKKPAAPTKAETPAAQPEPADKARDAAEKVSQAANPVAGKTADYSEERNMDRLRAAVQATKSGDEPSEPQRARIRRPDERQAAAPPEEDMKQTVLQMEALDPARLKASIAAAQGNKKRRTRPVMEPSKTEAPSTASELQREANARKEKQPSVLSRLAAAVRGEGEAESAPAGAAPDTKKKKKRRRGGFSETQWFMEGVKSDTEVLEASPADEKYERREDLSDEERRKYSLRKTQED